MISDKQKYCPKCGKPIPKSWKRHDMCGWVGGESPGKIPSDTRQSVEISPTGAVNSMMKEAVEEVCQVFDLTLTELMDEIDKYSSILNTIYISKRDRR